jgi:hypothetical protein
VPDEHAHGTTKTLGDHYRDRGGMRGELGQHRHCAVVVHQRSVRAAVVQQASDQNFCSTPDDQAQCALEARDVVESAGIPLGWSALMARNAQDGPWRWPLKVLGLLLSIGAATLGAPFWYRFLDRIGTLRNTGRPPSPDS